MKRNRKAGALSHAQLEEKEIRRLAQQPIAVLKKLLEITERHQQELVEQEVRTSKNVFSPAFQLSQLGASMVRNQSARARLLRKAIERRQKKNRRAAKAQPLRGETEGAHVSPPSGIETEGAKDCPSIRRKKVDVYIAEVLRKTHNRITRTDIWKTAGYKTRTEFERWERCDRRATKTADRNITRILIEKPHLK